MTVQSYALPHFSAVPGHYNPEDDKQSRDLMKRVAEWYAKTPVQDMPPDSVAAASKRMRMDFAHKGHYNTIDVRIVLGNPCGSVIVFPVNIPDEVKRKYLTEILEGDRRERAQLKGIAVRRHEEFCREYGLKRAA